jgi:hypothetical protein
VRALSEDARHDFDALSVQCDPACDVNSLTTTLGAQQHAVNNHVSEYASQCGHADLSKLVRNSYTSRELLGTEPSLWL